MAFATNKGGGTGAWSIGRRVVLLVSVPVLLASCLLGYIAYLQTEQAATADEVAERVELALDLGAMLDTAEGERGISTGLVAMSLLGVPQAEIDRLFPGTLSAEQLRLRSLLDTEIARIDSDRLSPELQAILAELPVIRDRIDDGATDLVEVEAYFDRLVDTTTSESDFHLNWALANLGSFDGEPFTKQILSIKDLNDLSRVGVVWLSQAYVASMIPTRDVAGGLSALATRQDALQESISNDQPTITDFAAWQSLTGLNPERDACVQLLLQQTYGPSVDRDDLGEAIDTFGSSFQASLEDLQLVNAELAAVPLAEVRAAAETARARAITVGITALALIAASTSLIIRFAGSVVRSMRSVQQRAESISAGVLDPSAVDDRNNPREVLAIERALDDLVGVLSLLERQATVLAEGDLQAAELEITAPGALGVAFAGTIRRLKQATARLHHSENEARAIIDNAAEAVVLVDHEGTITRFNQAAERDLGYLRLRDSAMDDLLPMWRHLSIDASQEVTIVGANREQLHLLVSTSTFEGEDGTVTALLWRDITTRKLNEETLAHQARHDHLTGLLNRGGLLRKLDDRVDGGLSSALIFLDLDRFKPVNDLFGHEAGDDVLREVGRRLHAAVRSDEFVARIGGDEFVVLSAAPELEIDQLAKRLIRSVAQPIELRNGETVRLGASAGWASASGVTSSELLRRADVALYLAKADEDLDVASYRGAVAERDDEERGIESELVRALQTDQLRLYGQPIVNLKTGATIGLEALVQWEHPERGLVSPALFIPVAERTDLILELDRWVLSAAIAHAASLPDDTMKISVNVSGRHLRRPELADTIADLLEQHRCDPRRVQIEMTETHEGIDSDAALVTVNRLRALGLTIALDDFGTGYSSLTHLLRVPVDVVKIDRSMVSIIDQPDGSAVVDAIIGYGLAQNVAVVAEGVETVEQATALRERGCLLAQGYFYSRPAPIDSFSREPASTSRT